MLGSPAAASAAGKGEAEEEEEEEYHDVTITPRAAGGGGGGGSGGGDGDVGGGVVGDDFGFRDGVARLLFAADADADAGAGAGAGAGVGDGNGEWLQRETASTLFARPVTRLPAPAQRSELQSPSRAKSGRRAAL